MSEYEKNVYTNLFEYPTKHIVKLELENEEKDKEIKRLNNIIDKAIEYIKDSGITFLNLANQRCFCNNNCADRIINLLIGGDKV